MQFETILSPAEIALLPERDLAGTLCVVFDILRATSTMTTAFAHGAKAIRPVCTVEEALALRREGVLLGGERHGDRIDGFDLGNSPLEYCRTGRASFAETDEIAMTTTNGTLALKACEHACQTPGGGVVAGALLNMGALMAMLRQLAPARVLLVCAGTGNAVALEDTLAAGMLAAAFPEAEVPRCDATKLATALYAHSEPDLERALRASTNGQVLLAKGREADVRWCAEVFRYPHVGFLEPGGVLVPRCFTMD